MTEDQIRQTIYERLGAAGLNMRHTSEVLLGRNPTYMQQYISKKVPRILPQDVREVLAPLIGLLPDDLRLKPTWKRKIDDKDGLNEHQRHNLFEPGKIARLPAGEGREIPILGTAMGGDGHGDFTFNGDTIDQFPCPPGLTNAKDVFAVYVRGDSMFPRFEQGELVIVHPGRIPRVGDYVIVELHGPGAEPGPAFIKRLVSQTQERLVVEQFQPVKKLTFDMNQVKSLYRVVPLSEVVGT